MAYKKGDKIFVLGLGKSGAAAARLLALKGCDVVVYDENAEVLAECLRSFEDIRDHERVAGAGPGGASDALDTCERVVVSPGVPDDHPLVVQARKTGKPVDGEIELAYHFNNSTIVGVTATNGKSTTVGIIGEMLATAGVRSVVAGNIGHPFADVVAEENEYEAVVLELSSFQLDTITEFKTDVAVLLNVTPDHLDRYHHSFDEYAASKARILNRTGESDTFVYNHDDTVCRRIAAGFAGNAIPFSSTTNLDSGVYLDGGHIRYAREGRVDDVLPRDRFTPIGIHNAENAMAAVAAVTPFGLDPGHVRAALESYRPLAHRMEPVRTVDGINFVNDSKATNVDATVKSLQSVEGGTVLILGGKDKEGDFRTLIPYLDRVRLAVLIGEASKAIKTALEGHCELEQASDMEDAVNGAYGRAKPGDTVLLAPACASFDMFKNYQDRGEVFRSCVNALEPRGK